MNLQRLCRGKSTVAAGASLGGATLSRIKGGGRTPNTLSFIKEQKLELENGKVLYVSSNHEKHRGTKIAFLRTSNVPNVTASCLLLKNGPTCFLFNCGENLYREIQRGSYIHQGCVIFIRSMDLSQVVGLPAMLSSGMIRQPMVVYGPQGLRQYLRSTLRACFVRVPTKYLVHELVLSNSLRVQNRQSEALLHEDELYGDDYVCSEDGFCELIKNEQCTVKAGVLCRSTQTWGFIYEEKEKKTTITKTSVGIVTGTLPESFVAGAGGVDVLVHDIPAKGLEDVKDSSKAMDAQCLVLGGCGSSLELENVNPKLSKQQTILALDHMTITISS